MMEPKDYSNENVLAFPERKAETPVEEKVEIKSTFSRRLAKTSKIKLRVYAFFTDLFFIGLLQKVLVFSYVNFVNEVFHQVPLKVKANLLGSLSEMRIQTLVFTFFSYFLVSLYLGHGKTLGKTLFKLRVLSFEDDPAELSFMESFMRTLGYTTCYVTGALNPVLPLLLFGLPTLRKDRKGIPDFFSQTEVVTEKEYEEFLMRKEEELLEAQKEVEVEEDLQLDLFAS